MATIQRRAFRFTPTGSEPLGFGFAGRIAVVLGCGALEVEGDVAFLLTVNRGCFNRIYLFPVAEGNLNPEGSVAGQGNFLTADSETG